MSEKSIEDRAASIVKSIDSNAGYIVICALAGLFIGYLLEQAFRFFF